MLLVGIDFLVFHSSNIKASVQVVCFRFRKGSRSTLYSG